MLLPYHRQPLGSIPACCLMLKLSGPLCSRDALKLYLELCKFSSPSVQSTCSVRKGSLEVSPVVILSGVNVLNTIYTLQTGSHLHCYLLEISYEKILIHLVNLSETSIKFILGFIENKQANPKVFFFFKVVVPHLISLVQECKTTHNMFSLECGSLCINVFG